MITDRLIQLLTQHWAAVLLSVILAWLVKNRYHNGLNKYPGPFLASLTDWWRFVDVYKRRPENTHIALHKKHGSVVRLGPNTLSFSDPEALKTIYGLNKGFIKSDFYIVQQSVVKGHSLPSLFSTTDNEFHMQFRRCVNSAFAMSALVQYEPFVDNTTKLFLKQTERLYIDDKTQQACDFTRWLQFYAFDVIGEITYSKRHGFVEKNEDIDGIVAYLTKLFLYVAPIGQIPILDRLFLKNPIYLNLSQWGFIDATFPVARFARARMAERMPELRGGDDTKTEKITKKEAGPPSPLLPTSEKQAKPLVKSPDLLSKFLAAREARPDFMTDTLVQTMAVSMAFAGSETTAISLSAVFYYLLKSPHALARLRAELDDAARRGVFSDYETGLVTWHESQTLPYLDACVKEAFRLHPAPGLPMERIVPEPGLEIAGKYVRGGTIVGCSAWVLHRNQDVFGADVEAYRPERWLVNYAGPGVDEVEEREDATKGEQRVKMMNGTMLQFGMGSRTCIGKNISLLEIYKLVPSMLRRFEIQFDDPNQEWEIVNAWFVKQNNFVTRFKLRELVMPEKGVTPAAAAH
ncbi:cytochrome P450-like protein [Apodospora peruviana]|uniref:Cytochrome P450-like protein n=1 Tax=Apodospora peruviana TaxID=516989 RepID=A0AAE0I0A8_9PEZI|nr:cytochrome P450-like protein [Apodospora peruviana]